MGDKRGRVLIFYKFNGDVPVHQIVVHQIDGAEGTGANVVERYVFPNLLACYELHGYCSRNARQTASTEPRCMSSQYGGLTPNVGSTALIGFTPFARPKGVGCRSAWGV